MRWRIRTQMLLPLAILLLGLVGISSWTAAASARRARQQIETQVRNVAHTLSEAHFPLFPNVLEQMKGLSGAEYLFVAADGRRTATLPVGAAPMPQDAVDDDWQALRLGPRVVIGETAYLCSGLRLRPPRADAGATLYILYPEALWRDALWEAVRPSLLLGVFGGAVAVTLTLGVAGRLVRRIQELERQTRLIAAGDFRPVPLPGRRDELHDLGRSINEMAQQLTQLQESMRKGERLRLLGQVSGGLAHQLRNGVAGARLAVQLHARECNGQADPEALDVALRQLARVEANLQRFLDLGRTGELQRRPCLLTRLIDETISLLRPQCRHARTELRWQPPGADVPVQGDTGQLGHLFLNVIGNAVEAAGPGGWVEVKLLRANCRAATVEVIDSGPGPSAEVAERLFEPFVTGKTGGVGLGLAVARQVAEAHGGRIGWRRETDRTCFSIELPVSGEW